MTTAIAPRRVTVVAPHARLDVSLPVQSTVAADTLAISVRTVRSHLDRIREKTGRRRRPELTRLAIEEGIANRPPGR